MRAVSGPPHSQQERTDTPTPMADKAGGKGSPGDACVRALLARLVDRGILREEAVHRFKLLRFRTERTFPTQRPEVRAEDRRGVDIE